MKLLLDIGNTKVTIYLRDEFNETIILLTDTKNTHAVGSDIFKLIAKYNIDSCFISSVVPEVNLEIIEKLEQNNIPTTILTSEDYNQFVDFGDLDYQKMGSDRVVVDTAAINKYGSNVIVFDLGTAITADVIKDNTYCSGYIFPGIRLVRDSLIDGTSQLETFEFVSLTENNQALNTFAQLNDGIMYGVLGSINQFIKVALKHYNETNKPQIILTGGSLYNILNIMPQEKLMEILENNVIIDMDLMIEGLDYISNKLGAKDETRKY